MFLWAIFFSFNMCSYDLIWFHATVQLTAPGGTQNTGDRITAMEQCGQGLFLRGLPGTGIGQTDEGHDFQFIEDANSSLTPSSQYLESDPGFFRLCWCRPSNFSRCDQPADFNVSAGLFIATGPYSGQSFQCQFGSRCIVMETDLRGVSLASGDQLLPLAECVGVVPSRTFLQPESVPGTINASTGAYHFDLGYLELNSSKPEVLQLCWCSARSSQCEESTGYRQVAMTLYVACPPGFYELQVAVGTEPMPGMSNRVLLRWGLASSSSPLSCRKHLTPWLKSIGSLWVQTWILLGWIARCLSKLPPWILQKSGGSRCLRRRMSRWVGLGHWCGWCLGMCLPMVGHWYRSSAGKLSVRWPIHISRHLPWHEHLCSDRCQRVLVQWLLAGGGCVNRSIAHRDSPKIEPIPWPHWCC